MSIVVFTLAFVGVLSIIFFIWVGWEVHKEEQAEKIRKGNEPVYTEEEEFYANLLQIKSDLDIDAFSARKAMLDEALRYRE